METLVEKCSKGNMIKTSENGVVNYKKSPIHSPKISWTLNITPYRQNIVAYLCGLVRIATKMVRCKTRCQYNLELRMTTRVGLYVFHCFTHTVTLWRTKTPTVQIWSRSVRQNRPSAIDSICKNNDLLTCRVEESSLSHNIIGGLKVWSYFS